MGLKTVTATDLVRKVWETDALPALETYIRIPNLSPSFQRDWAEQGHMELAVRVLRAWAEARPIDGLTVEVVRIPGRTPLLVLEVPPTPAACDGSASHDETQDDSVLLYGHLDKQPEFTGWRDGLGPWKPLQEGDRLYGRGAADDGYALFAALTAIEAVRAAGGQHRRALVLIEASEESGSHDLPAYLELLGERLGQPSLVVGLDSGCLTYDRLWVTTSLRGVLNIALTVEVLANGVHSGGAGGVVPSSFRILRALLSRVEDETTGELLLPELHVPIPAERQAQIDGTVAELGAAAAGEYPLLPGVATLAAGDPAAQLASRTWRPTLATLGADGLPPAATAGNVLRPLTQLKLSFRLPPTCAVDAAADAIRRAFTTDVPYGARVTVDVTEQAAGWNAPATEHWLATALEDASRHAFGAPARHMGEGGTIPFMAMLGERFPAAQFLITGVLGPESNAHGPNEFLHVPTATRVTEALAHVLDAHGRR